MNALVVFSTAPTLSEARKVAGFLLEDRLAACVNITGPLESHYRWQGKKRRDREFLLIIKTTRSRFSRLEKAIRKKHSYQTPEIIAVPVTRGSRDYLSWLALETSVRPRKRS
ncbi:MAG TPA: divalent-cation tolerance protein CutA [Verrucomicrobiae bacterium]|nr:divalent-cation tolerance protein CutA [Verrucomicrobiae bacterium]